MRYESIEMDENEGSTFKKKMKMRKKVKLCWMKFANELLVKERKKSIKYKEEDDKEEDSFLSLSLFFCEKSIFGTNEKAKM